ncbi:hypothetical protein [Novosphingobium huizhouense]|uniref:hypothetical protein n=1 Tax=Novosphingobium huizhouense TaxID=2866625 RepID=UPI001CD82988|nr:hypothetical protein [Novosphingobium huizhouense]
MPIAKTTRLVVLAPLAALALAGCGKQDADKGAPAAGGEVLPGTVSDAMIDLDTSTAQPPLQPVAPSGAARAARAPDDAASGAAEDQPAAEAGVGVGEKAAAPAAAAPTAPAAPTP